MPRKPDETDIGQSKMKESFTWPLFTQEEADTVSRVLLSNKVNYWTGSECREFENEFADYVGSEFAVAVSNGTTALDLALIALGIGPGDHVVVTPRTFIASVSSIVNCGATPIFADVNPESQNIDADTIKKVLSDRTRAILCVHLAGWPCDMDPILALARERGIFVVEDCAQAHGAKYKGRSVGTIGDIGSWSFCQDKIMTTGGEGGMITTNCRELWAKAWSFKDHGKSWDAVYGNRNTNGYRWLHESFGTNWRMTEMQAAVGRIQIRKMPSWTEKRNFNARAIWNAAKRVKGVSVPAIPSWITHAGYKCYIKIAGSEADRDLFIQELNDEGVPCFSGSCSEVYLEKAFEHTSFRPKERLEVAKTLGETSLMFLCHPTIATKDLDTMCEKIVEVGTRLFGSSDF